MSDYKIVNGKKVRICKYGCDTELVWSDEISGFIEIETKLAHTKQRCQEVKQNGIPLESQNKQDTQDLEKLLEILIKNVQNFSRDIERFRVEVGK